MKRRPHTRQSVYFPAEMIAEIEAEAARQGHTLSEIVQVAWRIARHHIIAKQQPDQAFIEVLDVIAELRSLRRRRSMRALKREFYDRTRLDVLSKEYTQPIQTTAGRRKKRE